MKKKPFKRIRKLTQKPRRRILFIAYLSLKFLIQQLPVKFGLKLGGSLGSLAFKFIRREREKTLRHLRKVFEGKKSEDEIRSIGERVFVNAGISVIEVMYVMKFGREYLEDNVTFEGKEYFDEAFASGKGVLGLTAHFGNWEVMVAHLTLVEKAKISVIAREMSNPDFDKYTDRIRERFNVKVLKRGTYLKDVFRLLRNGEGIGILADQDMKGNGIFIDFLGLQAYTQTGTVLIKLKTDAALLPIFIRRTALMKHTITAFEPIAVELTGDKEKDVLYLTQKCNDIISEQILKYPDQWMWMHNRWKTKKTQ